MYDAQADNNAEAPEPPPEPVESPRDSSDSSDSECYGGDPCDAGMGNIDWFVARIRGDIEYDVKSGDRGWRDMDEVQCRTLELRSHRTWHPILHIGIVMDYAVGLI